MEIGCTENIFPGNNLSPIMILAVVSSDASGEGSVEICAEISAFLINHFIQLLFHLHPALHGPSSPRVLTKNHCY